MTKKMDLKQTNYEKERGLRPRAKLEKNILSLIKELDDCDFHNIYSLVWSIGAKDLLKRNYKKDRDEYKKQIEEMKEVLK